MIIKYTFRLIKSTFNRFLAILAIVLIGVSFMMGLRSNYATMQRSVEEYYDENNLYDIQVYSNFGFDDNDVKEFNKLDYVEKASGSKTRDVYTSTKSGEELVIRVMELDSDLNNISLKQGRLPSKENECLIVNSYIMSDLSIGDKVNLYLESEELDESLKNTTFEIVGTCSSVENMSKNFSTSLLDNKNLNTVIYVSNNNFISDYYSTVYVKLKDSVKLDSFKDEYKDFVEEKTNLVRLFSTTQANVLRSRIVDEAREKIEEGIKELEENKVKYQKEIDNGKQELDEGKAKLDDALLKIQEAEIQIPLNEKKLKDAQIEIDNGYIELQEKQKQLDEAIARIESYGTSVDDLNNLYDRLYQTYLNAKAQRDDFVSQKNNLEIQKQANQAIIDESGYRSSIEVAARMALVRFTNPEEYSRLQAILPAFQFMESYNARVFELNALIATYDSAMNAANNTMKNTIGMNLDEVHDTLQGLVNGQALIEEGRLKLENGQKEINEGLIQIEAAKIQLIVGKAEYEKGLKEYEDGLKEYNDGVKTFKHKIQEAQDKIDDAQKEIEDLSVAKWTILSRYNINYSSLLYESSCDQMNSIGRIIPILFFVVAALVCATTMTRLIDEQRNQIGIYRALGFRKSEILGIYLLYVVFASFIASVFAIFIGSIIYPSIIYTTWRLLYDLPKMLVTIPLKDALICAFSFTLLIMAVTLIVASRNIRQVPAQLIRPKAPKNTKQLVIEKFKLLWNNLSFTGKITLRNILRYKGRFFVTVFGVAGCTSLLVLGFGIKDSISYIMSAQYKDVSNYDYLIQIKNDRHLDEIITEIKADENNEEVLAVCSYKIILGTGSAKTSIPVTLIDNHRVNNIYNIKDYYSNKPIYIGNEGIYMSSKAMDILGLKVNDEIEIESKQGIKAKVKIKAVVENYINHAIYMSEDLYQKTFDEDIKYTTINIINKNDGSKLYDIANNYNDIVTVNDIDDFTEYIVDMLEALNYIIAVIIVVAGALAFVVLINLTNVNISERIREIATLKVLGFRQHEVNSYIFKEVLLMSVAGAIIGLPLGALEERFVLTTITMDFLTFPHHIEKISYLYSFLITTIFTIIVLVLTRKTLRKVEMVESLKSVE